MHVLVFDTGEAGHHLAYVRLMLPPLIDLADRVVVVIRRSVFDSEPYRLQLGPLADRVEIDASLDDPPTGGARRAVNRFNQFRRTVRRIRPDHVYTSTADGLIQMNGAARALGLGIGGDVELEGALHYGRFAYPRYTVRHRLTTPVSLLSTAFGHWTRLHHVDVLVYQWIQARGGKLAQRSTHLPHPVEPTTRVDCREARRHLGLPEDGRYLGCVGIINRRKGCDLLIRAFAQAELGAKDRLLLMGRHAPGIAEMLRGEYAELVQSGRLISIDRYVATEDLGMGLMAMDLVCTPHNRHIGISSIVLAAVAAGRPVLAADFGWLQAIVPKLGLGWTCPVHDTTIFAKAIQKRLDDAMNYQIKEAARRLLAFHSVDNFRAKWSARLRERLGRPAADQTLSWDWVWAAVEQP